jgi:hypothetical protein
MICGRWIFPMKKFYSQQLKLRLLYSCHKHSHSVFKVISWINRWLLRVKLWYFLKKGVKMYPLIPRSPNKSIESPSPSCPYIMTNSSSSMNSWNCSTFQIHFQKYYLLLDLFFKNRVCRSSPVGLVPHSWLPRVRPVHVALRPVPRRQLVLVEGVHLRASPGPELCPCHCFHPVGRLRSCSYRHSNHW